MHLLVKGGKKEQNTCLSFKLLPLTFLRRKLEYVNENLITYPKVNLMLLLDFRNLIKAQGLFL